VPVTMVHLLDAAARWFVGPISSLRNTDTSGAAANLVRAGPWQSGLVASW